MLLGVEFDAHARDQVELRLQEIDMAFLVLHQGLEQVLGREIADLAAVFRRFLIERASLDLGLEIAFDHFLDGLADAQLVERLQVREALEEEDAVDEAVGPEKSRPSLYTEEEVFGPKPKIKNPYDEPNPKCEGDLSNWIETEISIFKRRIEKIQGYGRLWRGDGETFIMDLLGGFV